MDLTKLTDAELLSIDDDAIRVEKHRRDNLAKMPQSKAKVDDAIALSTLTDVVITEDEIDGDYVVADVSGMADPDAAMNVLIDDGAIFKANGKVRMHSNRAVKPQGHLEKLEAL